MKNNELIESIKSIMKNDELGDRMKDHESRTATYLPRRIFGLLRLDGKAFHTFTKELNRPFDNGFINDMNETAKFLVENIQGARFAYVQSDEITIMFTDYFDYKTELWFDGNIQKITSISASLATAKFNQLRTARKALGSDQNNYGILTYNELVAIKLAQFDSRVWSESLIEEAMNAFIWRQKDAVRNSIQMVAQSLYSHKQLEKKNQNLQQEMIFQKGQNWNDYPAGQKRGRMILKKSVLFPTTPEAVKNANEEEKELFIWSNDQFFVKRDRWSIDDAFDFNKEKDKLKLIFTSGKDLMTQLIANETDTNTGAS
jgi:tRNA(His) guanylyltransferase